MTAAQAIANLIRNPGELLIRRWNWKAALFSSLYRGAIYFTTNLSAGLGAASGAMLTEFAYRGLTAGFYGALAQSFCRVEPAWKATLLAFTAAPLIAHGIEFVVHLTRGTPNLPVSITVSICFTILSTLFNIYAMRRNALLVGPEGRSLLDDIRAFPSLVGGFVAAAPIGLSRMLRPRSDRRHNTRT